MADLYVDDDGDNSDGLTWATAFTAFQTAADAIPDGDTIWVQSDHTNAQASDTWLFSTDPALPNLVISVNTTTNEPPVAGDYEAGAAVTASGSSDVIIQGHVKFYGFSATIGDDFSLSQIDMDVYWQDGTITISGTSALFAVGHDDGRNKIHFKNMTLNFSSGGAATGFQASSGEFIWEGGTLSHSGTDPSPALFLTNVNNGILRWSGLTMTDIEPFPLIDVSDGRAVKAELHHCLLHANFVFTTGTMVDIGAEFLLKGCDDTTGNKLYRMEYENFYGTVEEDIANVVTTGGATDGTNKISWKMVSNENASEHHEPLISPPIVAWVDATGSTTFTVQGILAGGTILQNDEIWLGIEFLGSAASPISSISTDGFDAAGTNPLGTAADQATSSTAWTEVLASEVEFELVVTATVNRVGPVICRVYLAKPSTTAYIDPKVTVAAA